MSHKLEHRSPALKLKKLNCSQEKGVNKANGLNFAEKQCSSYWFSFNFCLILKAVKCLCVHYNFS